MAAFLQNHRRALRAVAPVAAHKGMRLMPVAHALNGLHAGDATNHAGIQRLLERLIKHRIAQHMAHHHLPFFPDRQPINIQAFLLINVVTLFISVLVLVGPSFLISPIHPAKSMRYE